MSNRARADRDIAPVRSDSENAVLPGEQISTSQLATGTPATPCAYDWMEVTVGLGVARGVGGVPGPGVQAAIPQPAVTASQRGSMCVTLTLKSPALGENVPDGYLLGS